MSSNINKANVSFGKDPIDVKVDQEYLVIDALYLKEIQAKGIETNGDNFLKIIKEQVFVYPYSEFCFAVTSFSRPTFEVRQIKKYAENETNHKIDKERIFCSDTGLLLIINLDIAVSLISKINYDELVNGDWDTDINIHYWRTVAAPFEYSDLALILSPGINSGVDFVGGGLYYIGY